MSTNTSSCYKEDRDKLFSLVNEDRTRTNGLMLQQRISRLSVKEKL